MFLLSTSTSSRFLQKSDSKYKGTECISNGTWLWVASDSLQGVSKKTKKWC